MMKDTQYIHFLSFEFSIIDIYKVQLMIFVCI